MMRRRKVSSFVITSAIIGLLGCSSARTSTPSGDITTIVKTHTAPRPGGLAGDYFRNPTFSRGRLSPDGQHIAAVRSVGREDTIVVWSLTTGEEKELFTEKRGERPDSASRGLSTLLWAGNQYVVFSIDMPFVDEYGNRGAIGTRARKSRLYSVNLDGRSRYIGEPWPWDDYIQIQDGIMHALPNSPRHVLIDLGDVVRVNVRNSGLTQVVRNRRMGTGWHATHDGAVRLSETFDPRSTGYAIYARTRSRGTFAKIASHDPYEERGVRFAGYSPDPEKIYVFSDLHSDKAALHLFDLKSKELGELVFADPEYDVYPGRLITSMVDGRLLAIRYLREGLEIVAIDPAWRESWNAIASAFPNADFEIASVCDDRSIDESRLLLKVSSDTDPPSIYFADIRTGETRLLYHLYPQLEDAGHAEMRPIRFQARDGREIHGYLTRPIGADSPGAVVVYPNRGPEARSRLGWNPTVQYLARLGLSVLQVDYRGSVGYGRNHRRAGDREWGRKVQDDITDSARWLIAEGIALPGHVGIFGKGYGGFLALQAMILESKEFAAAASFGGVFDLPDHLRYGGRFNRRDALNSKLIGDRDLAVISPSRNASRVNGPVLLMHGSMNPTFHRNQTIKMGRALERAGKPVEQILYPSATSSFFDEMQRVDFIRRLGDFFVTHLGVDTPAPAKLSGKESGNGNSSAYPVRSAVSWR
jgi:dipeptidyl aminopeptidase/acylaminoacyl peptidase